MSDQERKKLEREFIASMNNDIKEVLCDLSNNIFLYCSDWTTDTRKIDMLYNHMKSLMNIKGNIIHHFQNRSESQIVKKHMD